MGTGAGARVWCSRLGEVLLQGPEDEADRREEEVGQCALEGRDRVTRLGVEQLARVELDVGAVAAKDRALPEVVVTEFNLVRVRVGSGLGYRGAQG